MDAPMMMPARTVAPDTVCLPAYVPIPDYGALGVNTFVIKGSEPILVDTSAAAFREPFLAGLESVIDPADLRWIWISHTDADHVGNLRDVLERAPKAKVVTTFLGTAKLGLLGHDLGRVHLLQPGDEIVAGDRTLVPMRPPYYDAPETKGFFDTKSRVLFTADSFGALLPGPVENANEIPEADLAAGMATWAGLDAPWLGMLDRVAFGKVLSNITRLDPSVVISGHLAEARGMTGRLLRTLAALQPSVPTDVPDHAVIERLTGGHDLQAAVA